uniref:Protein HID1 n=1 Tax=Ditylenchus dipsaci TaxID=166011 RepID=A0A915DID7_9BILA
MLKGLTRLLNNPLQASYLPNSSKKVMFHQELLVLLWKCCEYNQKFMYYVLKTSDVLEILVPILYHINDARGDPARVGLIHMGVFLILLLSGERNFGVRLNKPFSSRGIIDVQAFTGTHADLLIIVFHKLITTGNHRLQSLFDCLLTIIVNVSPYLKSLSMVTANKLVHLVEAFSTPWFLFSSPTNHHLVFFLLEMFNNIIQYQFDGNSNLIYTIIRKRQVFYQLSNLSSDAVSIAQSLKKSKSKNGGSGDSTEKCLPTPSPWVAQAESGSTAASSSAPQTIVEENKVSAGLKSSLADTPQLNAMIDKSADWSQDSKPAVEGPEKIEEASWVASPEWVESWKKKLPLQTIMRVLQILVPQVEKICIDKGLTDETENRHVLPLFTSLLNVVCSYDPVGYGLPYNYLLVNDSREPLVQAAIQVLIVCLDRDLSLRMKSRIHREKDFDFMLKGLTRLLNNPLQASYLPNSSKKVMFHQELLVLLWKCCEYNQKFMYYVLKTSDVLEILVRSSIISTTPEEIRLDGERNFGVRLNKPFSSRGIIDVQAFTGFSQLITTGNHRLQSLFDCLLTIIVNVSPYLKSLSMVTANKLVHLVEAFSTPWFLFSSPTNHHLVFFLLEMFNNIIQYQFDGNSNLIYTIIRKRQVFYQLSNLSSDAVSIAQSLKKSKSKNGGPGDSTEKCLPTPSPWVAQAESGSTAASSSAPQTTVEENKVSAGLKSSLADTPQLNAMIDKSADWSQDSKPAVEGPEKIEEASWVASPEWVESWKKKLPLQTIMRVLQILVPQVEKICIDKGLTDETTNHWFRTYMWGIIYIRNTDPPIWYDTEVNLFEIQRV